MIKIKRTILLVIDGVGIGELPDAYKYGDEGSNTLGNLAEAIGGLKLPNFQKMGLGNIAKISGVESQDNPMACYGKMAEQSPGKDSTTGHWEIAGCILDFAFPTYPKGFPPEVIDSFIQKVGKGILGNKPASGTDIIKELGMEHLKTGKPIVYTSADSVFQIAAHKEVIPLEELYHMCQIAREILTGNHAVSRVIARPFVGDSPENFTRTSERRDFSLKPPRKLLQNYTQENGFPTIGIGKIDDLYAGVGWDVKLHTSNNAEGMEVLLKQMKTVEEGLIMINLVDFDMLWGHRNDVYGFKAELERLDQKIPEFLEFVGQEDLFIITADHGNDPTTPSTDHSREYVPVLVYGPSIKSGVNIGTRSTFADLGKTIAEAMQLKNCQLDGTSFWSLITN